MPWWCLACGSRRGGPHCKKRCIAKHGDMGAERVPPLDGFLRFDADPSTGDGDDMAARAVWFAVKRNKESKDGRIRD